MLRSKSRFRIILPAQLLALATLVCALFGSPPGATAQAFPDLSGEWPITTLTTTSQRNECIADITQSGGTIGGSILCGTLGRADVNGTITSTGIFGAVTNFTASAVTINWDGTATPTSASGHWSSSGGPPSSWQDTWQADRCGTDDTDGDALLDCWESGGVDFNNDGVVDLPINQPVNAGLLNIPGASPSRKDIFVEIDYTDCALGPPPPFDHYCPSGDTHSDRPQDLGLAMVMGAFNRAPVSNPDGSTGVTLHPIVDEPLQHDAITLFNNTFDTVKHGSPPNGCGTGPSDGHFGTPADRASANCRYAIAARVAVYHYAIFAHDAGGPSGLGEQGGNDLMVGIALFPEAFARYGRADREARVFMHELGHNLNLDHGGVGDPTNCKPNYFSLMNYTYNSRLNDPTSPLDYSISQLPNLFEQHLNENAGVSGPANRRVIQVYPEPGDPPGNVDFNGNWDDDGDGDPGVRYLPADGPIDWNDNHVLEGDVPVDINTLGSCGASSLEELRGNNDWPNLRYNFRESTNFQDYTHGFPSNPHPSVEEELALANSLDFDGDGYVNAQDNCPEFSNPNQSDTNGDGIGDACATPAVGGVAGLAGAERSERNSPGEDRMGSLHLALALAIVGGLAMAAVAVFRRARVR